MIETDSSTVADAENAYRTAVTVQGTALLDVMAAGLQMEWHLLLMQYLSLKRDGVILEGPEAIQKLQKEVCDVIYNAPSYFPHFFNDFSYF